MKWGTLFLELLVTIPKYLLMTMIVTIPSAVLLFIRDIRAKVFSKENSFLLIPFLIMFSFFVLKSFSGKIQLNWTIPLFLTLIPLLSYAVNNKTKSVIALSFFILGQYFCYLINKYLHYFQIMILCTNARVESNI